MTETALSTIDIKLPTETEQEYTLETLPPLTPQQATMLDYILQGYNYTQSYKMANYSCTEWANSAAWQLVMRNPLKAHIDFYTRLMAKKITAEYIVGRLNSIAEQCMNPENAIKNGDTAIKAIDVINKMQGNYAATNVQINSVNATVEDIRNARKEYIKDR